jgi:PAS domain S-box-containing protein
VSSRALELTAAGVPQTGVLSELAEAVERECDGLSISISLVDGSGRLHVARDSPAVHRSFACSSTPIVSRAFELLGTLTTFADHVRPVTERERELVESAVPIARFAIELARLRDSEAGYRALVEQMPAIAYIADPGEEGRWYYVSPQVEAMLGYTSEEFLADDELWLKRLHPDDRERVIADEAGAVAGMKSASAAEYRMRSHAGHVVWIRDDALLVRDELGRLRWHGVLSDITTRKQAEAEIEQRVAQQAAVARLGERALEGAALEELMDDAVVQAARILDVDVGSVLELVPDGGVIPAARRRRLG